MNKRVRELAEQARDYTDKAIDCGWLNGDEIFEGKFAELIVRECILRCNETLVPHTGQPSMTHNYAVGLCQDKIKEHFGVEE